MSSSRVTTFCASVSFLPGWLTTCFSLTAFKSNLCFSCERNDLHTFRLLGYQTLIEYLMQDSFWKQMPLNIENITWKHAVITCYQSLEIPCECNGVSTFFFPFQMLLNCSCSIHSLWELAVEGFWYHRLVLFQKLEVGSQLNASQIEN